MGVRHNAEGQRVGTAVLNLQRCCCWWPHFPTDTNRSLKRLRWDLESSAHLAPLGSPFFGEGLGYSLGKLSHSAQRQRDFSTMIDSLHPRLRLWCTISYCHNFQLFCSNTGGGVRVCVLHRASSAPPMIKVGQEKETEYPNNGCQMTKIHNFRQSLFFSSVNTAGKIWLTISFTKIPHGVGMTGE